MTWHGYLGKLYGHGQAAMRAPHFERSLEGLTRSAPSGSYQIDVANAAAAFAELHQADGYRHEAGKPRR